MVEIWRVAWVAVLTVVCFALALRQHRWSAQRQPRQLAALWRDPAVTVNLTTLSSNSGITRSPVGVSPASVRWFRRVLNDSTRVIPPGGARAIAAASSAQGEELFSRTSKEKKRIGLVEWPPSSQQCFPGPRPGCHAPSACCLFHNVTLVVLRRLKCYRRSLRAQRYCTGVKRLLYVAGEGSGGSRQGKVQNGSMVQACQGDFQLVWCKVPLVVTSAPAVTRELKGIAIRRYTGPVYLFGRWKTGTATRAPNPVHYMFEGLWVMLYITWRLFGWHALFTTPVIFLDPLPVQRHDWAKLLLPEAQLSSIGVVPEDGALFLPTAMFGNFVDFFNMPYYPAKRLMSLAREGGILGAEVVPAVLDRMNWSYHGFRITYENISDFVQFTPARQVQLMSQVDVYISDGGTTSFYGLLMRPGSASIRTAKCMQCLCAENTAPMFFWFNLSALAVRHLWLSPAHPRDCVPTGKNFLSIRLRPETLEPTLRIALQHVVDSRRGTLPTSSLI
eukprot:RCo043965